MLLMYAGGIAALAEDKYENLAAIMMTKVGSRHSGAEAKPIIVPATEGMLDVTRADLFKSLPGHERQYAPKSEYLFKTLQPMLEDLLFLGTSYERLFDRFEVLYALVVADCNYDETYKRLWGPPGRFGWKLRDGNNPFSDIIAEAEREQGDWPPLRAGLFGGSCGSSTTLPPGYGELRGE